MPDKNGETATVPANAPSAGAQQQRQQLKVRYIDLPECAETFADSITAVAFDGQSLRIEFGITRMDDVKPDTPMTGRRYPACRLVLSPTAAAELIGRMQQIGAALVQAGVMKAAPAQAAPAKEKAGK
jgi:hypothetical protein